MLLLTGCRRKEEQLRPIVIVEKPSKEDVSIFGEYVGRIRAASYVEVHARVEGYLEKMLFEEGKQVSQNAPPVPYQLGQIPCPCRKSPCTT